MFNHSQDGRIDKFYVDIRYDNDRNLYYVLCATLKNKRDVYWNIGFSNKENIYNFVTELQKWKGIYLSKFVKNARIQQMLDKYIELENEPKILETNNNY